MQGINDFDKKSNTDLIAFNQKAFESAKSCGTILHKGKGTFILVFDSGLMQKSSNNRAWLGGISALAKTAKLEWPEALVQSINIDCNKKAVEQVAQELFKTITAGGIHTELEIDAQGKSIHFEPNIEEVTNRSKPFHDGDTIVVSGGARGVTASCLIELSTRKKLNIGLLGRTSLEEEPAYLATSITDAELKGTVFTHAKNNGIKISPLEMNAVVSKTLGNREVRSNINQLEANGSTVRYMSVDIANSNAVNTAFEQLRQEFGPIQGIVHAAGVLADKYIHEKTIDQYQKVFNTKIDGFVNLLEATKNDPLTHICCFSSVAARMGNVGQVDYAMANEVLNKVCQSEQKKRGAQCIVKSLNWGPWDGGMVSEPLKKHFASMGVDLIPMDRGAQIFADEMEDASTENVEIVVGGSFELWGDKKADKSEKIREIWVHKSNCSFLNSHKIEGKVIVPMMMANEWCMRLAKSILPNLFITAVNDVKVYKGISLDHFETNGNVLQFKYSTAANESGTLVNIKIQNKKGQLFYGVDVQLSTKSSIASVSKNTGDNLKPWGLNKKDIYEKSLFHGPDFQVIEKLEGISNAGARSLLTVTETGNRDLHSSDLFLFDGGIQTAILAMENWTGNKSSLPLGFESLSIFNQPKLADSLSCDLTLTKKNDMNSEWDLDFKNADQEVVAQMKGLRMYMYQSN